jgi:hypothetical protein
LTEPTIRGVDAFYQTFASPHHSLRFKRVRWPHS